MSMDWTERWTLMTDALGSQDQSTTKVLERIASMKEAIAEAESYIKMIYPMLPKVSIKTLNGDICTPRTEADKALAKLAEAKKSARI